MKTFIIKLVKSAEVVVKAESLEMALEMVDMLDSDGSIELQAEYYDVNTNMLLN
jgi:hypothetical protein